MFCKAWASGSLSNGILGVYRLLVHQLLMPFRGIMCRSLGSLMKSDKI